MVVPYAGEKPNLSYVRINQNTSDGTGPSIKTYITKGLVCSDPYVVNASLLHRTLVAQPVVQTNVETTFWGNLELPNESQDDPKSLSKSEESVPLDNRSATSPAASASPASSGMVPRGAAFMRSASDEPLTSVRLPEGAILVKMDPEQQSSTPNPTISTPSSPTVQISSTRGVKRKLDEVDKVEYPRVVKVNALNQKLVFLRSRQDLIKENQHLEKTNKLLVDENQELRDKLALLSKILKDPRKRDMLNARLGRMQKTAC